MAEGDPSGGLERAKEGQMADEAPRRDFGAVVIQNLRRAGVQNGYRDERLEFNSMDPYPDGGWVAATGWYTDGRWWKRPGNAGRRGG